MVRSKVKGWGLALAAALSGSFALSCSGTFARELRDAAATGASNFVTQQTFDLLAALFPDAPPEE